MVINNDLPGVDIEIIVDGNALHGHGDKHACFEERTVTRYIECVSGQVYSIAINLLPEFKYEGNCISFEISVDGNACVDVAIQESDRHQEHLCEGAVSKGKVQKFTFAQFDPVTNDQSDDRSSSKIKELGTIKIVCHHEWTTGKRRKVPKYAPAGEVKVSEKVIKGSAISHKTAFTTPRENTYGAPMSLVHTDPVAGVPTPAATFVFVYRSLDALKAMLVVPRTPEPVPLEDRDPNTYTISDIQELQRRLRAQRDQLDAKPYVELNSTHETPRRFPPAFPAAGSVLLEIDDDGAIQESIVSANASAQ